MSHLDIMFKNLSMSEQNHDDILSQSMQQFKINEDDISIQRKDKAEQYFIELINIIQTNPHDIIKFNFLQKMSSVIQTYYQTLFPNDNWKNIYDHTHNIDKYDEIRLNMIHFVNQYMVDSNNSLLLLKQIYIEMFKLNQCFPQFYDL